MIIGCIVYGGTQVSVCVHTNWCINITPAGNKHPLRLLSASMDKTMILWQPDAQSGVWLEQVSGNGIVFKVVHNALACYCFVHWWCKNMYNHSSGQGW